MGSMIIWAKDRSASLRPRSGVGACAGSGVPAHLSIIFEIFVRPTQLLYQYWI